MFFSSMGKKQPTKKSCQFRRKFCRPKNWVTIPKEFLEKWLLYGYDLHLVLEHSQFVLRKNNCRRNEIFLLEKRMTHARNFPDMTTTSRSKSGHMGFI